LLNGFSNLSLSGEMERSILDSVLGVQDILGVFKVDDGIEREMNCPLNLGRVCQARLENVEGNTETRMTLANSMQRMTRNTQDARHRKKTHKTRLVRLFESCPHHHDGTVAQNKGDGCQ